MFVFIRWIENSPGSISELISFSTKDVKLNALEKHTPHIHANLDESLRALCGTKLWRTCGLGCDQMKTPETLLHFSLLILVKAKPNCVHVRCV